jgi:hypothetical protein
MSRIVNIGRRVELISADALFQNISVGLYRQDTSEGTRYVVHTYSQREGAEDRIDVVAAAMVKLGGMDRSTSGTLGFPCGASHLQACRRLFLDAARRVGHISDSMPLTIHDSKSERLITIVPKGSGVYGVTADGPQEGLDRRTVTVARGLSKLAGVDADPNLPDTVAFSCGHDHHGLIGLLLVRALNVRATMREIEEQNSKGLLTAPSAPAE